jgi:hypothetical protein
MNVESKRIKHSFIIGNKLLNYMEQGEGQKKEQQEIGIDNPDAYISQMSPFELSAYRIAKSHLGTSFNLKKSNGFLKWISARR